MEGRPEVNALFKCGLENSDHCCHTQRCQEQFGFQILARGHIDRLLGLRSELLRFEATDLQNNQLSECANVEELGCRDCHLLVCVDIFLLFQVLIVSLTQL